MALWDIFRKSNQTDQIEVNEANDNDVKPFFKNKKDELNFEKRKNIEKRDKLKEKRKTGLYFASGFTLIAFLAFFFFYVSSNFALIIVIELITAALVFLVARDTIFSTRDVEIKIDEISNELDLEEIEVGPTEKRAEKLFTKHQIELQKYYDLTLNQSRWIFFGGILCLLIGFSIIIVTFYLLFVYPSSNLFSDKLFPLIFGGISAILTNYIAVLYLKMYSEINKSLITFHNRLVSSNHLQFSNYLVAKIDDKEKRENTLASIALEVAKNGCDAPITENEKKK
jgi:hypothetical protein